MINVLLILIGGTILGLACWKLEIYVNKLLDLIERNANNERHNSGIQKDPGADNPNGT